MKRINLIFVLAIVFAGCGEQSSTEYGNNPFYFYEEEEAPLKQIENKIFIQFSNPAQMDQGPIDWVQWETDWDQWNILLNRDAALQENMSTGGWSVLESKNGKRIPQATIEYFMASPVVATASFPFEVVHNGVLQGIRNEIAVQLKETTSYEQLQQLVEQYNCTIGIENPNPLVKNQFFVTVPKTYELNAILMSDLFYETNLFESVQPVYVVLNRRAFCDQKIILKALKDEPAYMRKKCFQHVGSVDAFYFEFENIHNIHNIYLIVFPVEEIPKQFRQDSLSVNISGNVISCVVLGGCSEPHIKLGTIQTIELKSIKTNKQINK